MNVTLYIELEGYDDGDFDVSNDILEMTFDVEQIDIIQLKV